MLREKGKKLFLLTNSPYYFVDGGMRFMLEVSQLTGNSTITTFNSFGLTTEAPFRPIGTVSLCVKKWMLT